MSLLRGGQMEAEVALAVEAEGGIAVDLSEGDAKVTLVGVGDGEAVGCGDNGDSRAGGSILEHDGEGLRGVFGCDGGGRSGPGVVGDDGMDRRRRWFEDGGLKLCGSWLWRVGVSIYAVRVVRQSGVAVGRGETAVGGESGAGEDVRGGRAVMLRGGAVDGDGEQAEKNDPPHGDSS